MNRFVSAISGRLSLRGPQTPVARNPRPDHRADVAQERRGRDAALVALKAEWPTVADFEREFPSVCFALATGVGKTRLMGAFIGYGERTGITAVDRLNIVAHDRFRRSWTTRTRRTRR